MVSFIPQLEVLSEKNNKLCGYLYQEDNFLVHNEDQIMKDIIKIISFKELNAKRNLMIDHRFPSIIFSKDYGLPVEAYDASDDFEKVDPTLKQIHELLTDLKKEDDYKDTLKQIFNMAEIIDSYDIRINEIDLKYS